MNRLVKHTSIVLAAFTGIALVTPVWGEGFWDQTRTGANAFNKVQTEDWFEDASELGVSWVRLAFDKWEGRGRDFLVGNAGDYKGLVAEDLATLVQALDWAHENGLKVVVAPLTLPGARYSQNNGFEYDSRLWKDTAYWESAQSYWQDLASAIKDHPAVSAYNLLNEPAPELHTDIQEHAAPGSTDRFEPWYQEHRSTSADLFAFYNAVIPVIREVDNSTPIMVDAGWYAQPSAFTYWPGPLDDENVLYAFHMYEPYAFTSHGNFKDEKGLSYPGLIPFAGEEIYWSKETVREYLRPFYEWAKENNIPQNRLVAGEFGCYRRNTGCQQYISDVIDVLEENETHWAFYSFREDEWDGYDYEVGTDGLPWEYWKAVDRGEKPEVPRHETDIFLAIKSRLR